jgi:hypothetical protein
MKKITRICLWKKAGRVAGCLYEPKEQSAAGVSCDVTYIYILGVNDYTKRSLQKLE